MSTQCQRLSLNDSLHSIFTIKKGIYNKERISSATYLKLPHEKLNPYSSIIYHKSYEGLAVHLARNKVV